MNNATTLWVYHRLNAMTQHRFVDDVAVTYAATKAEAVEKFKCYYDVTENDVEEVQFTSKGVGILTDY